MSDLVREYRETMHADVLRLWARDAVAELSRLSALVASRDKDAERWRALLRCARIRMQGSAGFDPETGERREYSYLTRKDEPSTAGWVHFGAEFWSVYPGAEDPNPATRWGTIALTALADDVLLKEAALPAPPVSQLKDTTNADK